MRAVRQQSELAVLDLRFKYLLTDNFISLFVPLHHSHTSKSRAEGSTGSCCHESGLAAARLLSAVPGAQRPQLEAALGTQPRPLPACGTGLDVSEVQLTTKFWQKSLFPGLSTTARQ